MRFSVDPKPFGAFIEYTLKPILEDAREVLDLLGLQGVNTRRALKAAVIIFIFDKIQNFILTVTITGIVCYTAYSIASNSPLTLR